MHPLFGPFMVVLFCLSQALRDVYQIGRAHV